MEQQQLSEDQPQHQQQQQLGFPSSDSDDHSQPAPPQPQPKSQLQQPPSDLDQTADELQGLELNDDAAEEDDRKNVSDEREYVNVESGWEIGDEEEKTVNDYDNEWCYDHGENFNESERVEEEQNESRNYYNYDDNNNRYQYPVRPEAEDCAFYMKTGTCKFGSNCKFNHPVRRKNHQGVKEKVKEKEELGEKQPGQTECKYYLRTGGCKYGKSCRYNHSKTKTMGAPASELNFLGLPIRLGEKECPYYMRHGSCKYGANCRFNHPDPTAVGGSDTPSGYGNGVAVSSQAAAQLGAAPWSSPSALNDTASYVPLVYPPAQGVPSQSPEWNSYQAPPMYPPPARNLHPPSPYVMNNLATETNVYTHHPQQMLVDEFPERPGQPECSYYLKTGDCKFKSNCKYHHPKNRMPRSPPCALSDKGLPLRPDQMVCSHYNRYGICKFGPACKFDHPVQPASPTASGEQPTTFGGAAAAEEPRMAGNGNGSDVAIQQPA